MMDSALYRAAEKGNIDPFENYQTCLDQLMTPNQNTILHVYLESQSKKPEFTDFVDLILEMCPPLLLQVNIKGETPLHFAARYGHANVVKVLIDRAKALPIDAESGLTEAEKMMRMINVEKDTALHEAARNGRSNVAEILTKEDPSFTYAANDRGETPLYIATWVRSVKVTNKILRNCSSVEYGGPYGRTALHAAVMLNDVGTAKKLLLKENNLTKTTDENGWSPLHYAAYFNWHNPWMVKLLLKHDVTIAYIADKNKKRTALHMAAIEGKVFMMKEIATHCPDCCEQVDSKGWNALHYAVASRVVIRVFKESLKIPELAKLITQKDEKGNTPLHLVAAISSARFWKNIPLDWRIKSDICGLNKQNLSIKEILPRNFPETKKEVLDTIKDVRNEQIVPFMPLVVEKKWKKYSSIIDRGKEAHLVAAVLIATVTFAAAFTVPGGYKNEQGPNEGTAILSKNAAFCVFIISNAISMVLSLSAVFIHFLLAPRQVTRREEVTFFGWALSLTMIAMGTMVLAFITGTFAVLAPSLALATTTCVIGLCFFVIVFMVLKKTVKIKEDPCPHLD